MAEPAQVQPWKAAKIPRTPKTFTIFVGQNSFYLVEQYRKIVERDGHSISSEILSFITNEVNRRTPGNPQSPLERYEKTPEENLHSMTFAQLSFLYEDVKTRVRQSQLPIDEEMARFRLIQREMAERERVFRLR